MVVTIVDSDHQERSVLYLLLSLVSLSKVDYCHYQPVSFPTFPKQNKHLKCTEDKEENRTGPSNASQQCDESTIVSILNTLSIECTLTNRVVVSVKYYQTKTARNVNYNDFYWDPPFT